MVQTDGQSTPPVGAALASLRLALAASWLGGDGSGAQPGADLLRDLLQEAAGHDAAPARTAVALLTPSYLAAAAAVAASGMSQVHTRSISWCEASIGLEMLSTSSFVHCHRTYN